jgi:myo-inositol-1-phosphate synthase
MGKVKVAFIGVGNCVSAIVQGIQYYKNKQEKDFTGIMHGDIGGYKVTDIVPVAAFDVDVHKVGKDLSEAIFAEPNCALKFADVPNLGVEVMMGPVMDGVTEHLAKMVKVSKENAVDVENVLKELKPDVVVNNLPTGSIEASKFYATAAINAGAAFVNGMPALIANDEQFVAMATEKGVPLIGDDIKSQIGGTIFHRTLLKLFMDRGAKIKNTYQLNVGGNSDFFNQLTRKETKLYTKMSAYKSLVPYEFSVWGGAAGYIEHLQDTKQAWTILEGEEFGGIPVKVIAWFEVSDSPNYAGCMVEAIRCAKVGLDRKVSGVLTSASAYFTKCPPEKLDDNEAKKRLDEFIEGKRER